MKLRVWLPHCLLMCFSVFVCVALSIRGLEWLDDVRMEKKSVWRSWTNCPPSSPYQAFYDFVNNLRQGATATVLDWASPSLKAKLQPQDIDAMLRSIGKLKYVVVEGSQISPNGAQFYVTAKTKNRIIVRGGVISLIRLNGQWLVDDFFWVPDISASTP